MAALPLNVLSARCCCRGSLSSSSPSTSQAQSNARSPASAPALSGRSVASGVTISGAASDHCAPVKSDDERSEFCFAKACAKLGLIGLAAAAICYTNPALAYKTSVTELSSLESSIYLDSKQKSFCFGKLPIYKYRKKEGGGPYGMEVTRGQDLSGKDFSGKTLIKQDFKTSILRQCNFKGAKLLGASFFDSDLTGADLTDADLRGADFSLANAAKANMTNANLEGATVTGNTSFKGTIITGADFTDVLWRDDQRVALCKVAGGVNPVTGNATRDTLLCSD